MERGGKESYGEEMMNLFETAVFLLIDHLLMAGITPAELMLVLFKLNKRETQKKYAKLALHYSDELSEWWE